MYWARFFLGNAIAILAIFALLSSLPGCRRPIRDDLSYDYGIEQTWQVEELSGPPMVQFESVFWEPDDTDELRRLITEEGLAKGRDCLEIGTGTGLLSILCLAHGANKVVATDINPAAVACARYNAAQYALDDNFEVRQVDPAAPGAFTVIKPGEKFDVILSNPPWEDGQISKPADYAFYDPGFQLLESIVVGLPQHLKPGGRCLLSYGSVAGVEKVQALADEHDLQLKILDERDLETLAPNFLPGMLIELRVKPSKVSTQEALKETSWRKSEPAVRLMTLLNIRELIQVLDLGDACRRVVQGNGAANILCHFAFDARHIQLVACDRNFVQRDPFFRGGRC